MIDNVESRISTKLYDKPTILSVVMTSKCNLDCSFCGGAYYMNREDSSRAFQRERILELLQENPAIKEIHWTGGEPLLVQRKIEDFVNELKVSHPHLEHHLYTNGLKLRKSHLTLLKDFEHVFVSIDGYKRSERPFMRFIEEDSHEALEALYELDNFQTWAVITRDQLADKRWYEDIVELHRAMYHYRPRAFSLMFDAQMPKPLSPDHIMNFVYGYLKIQENMERLNVQTGESCGVSVSKIFENECNVCSEELYLNADGTEHQLQNAPAILNGGCNQLACSIGVGAYEYIKRVIYAERKRISKDEQ